MGIRKTHQAHERTDGMAERGGRPRPWPLTRDDMVLAILWIAVVVGFLALVVFAVLKFR